MASVAVSSVLFKEKLFNLMFLSPTNSVSFYSSLSRPQQPISLHEFSSSQLPNGDGYCDVTKDAPVELQGITPFSIYPPSSPNWLTLCSLLQRCGSPCPSALLTLEGRETRHFPAFPAAIRSADNRTTLQLLALFMEIFIKRGTLLKHNCTDACLCKQALEDR